HRYAGAPPVPHSAGQLTVELANSQRCARLSTKRLRPILRRVLECEQVTQGHIEVALVDDETIARLHSRFLKLNTPTDVLTFQLNEPEEPLSGLVVVSVETAVRQAPRYRHA